MPEALLAGVNGLRMSASEGTRLAAPLLRRAVRRRGRRRGGRARRGCLHREPGFAGVLSAIQGGGTVLGGMIAGSLLRRAGEARLSAVGGLLFAVSVALRAVPWTPVVAAASLLSGLGSPWVLVAALTAVQRIAPRDLLATVSATADTVLFVPTAVGMALGAGLLVLTSYRPVLWAAALAGALAAAYGLREPRGAVTTADRDTSAAC